MTLLSFLPPFLLGYGILTLAGLWSGRERPELKLLLSGLAGFGAATLLYFFWRAAGFPSGGEYALAEGALSLALAGAAGLRKAPPESGPPAVPEAAAAPRWLPPLALLCTAVILACIVRWFSLNPHGTVDAWAIWNLHARFLHRGGADWYTTYAGLHEMTHADYPLLVSALQARFWAFAGEGQSVLPVLLVVVLAYGTAFALLRQMNAPVAAWLSLLVLLTPFAARQAASQAADLPLAVFIAASAAFVCFGGRLGFCASRAAALAGLFAGLAAWTKNEGKLFLLVALLVQTVLALRERGTRSAAGSALRFLAGAAPSVLALLVFRMLVPVTSDVMPGDAGSVLPMVLDLSRYLQIGGAFLYEIATFGSGAPWVLAAYVWLARPGRTALPETLAPIAVTVLLLGGYFAVYVISPWDLGWHLASSLNRLLLHPWPLIVLAALAPAEGTPASPENSPHVL